MLPLSVLLSKGLELTLVVSLRRSPWLLHDPSCTLTEKVSGAEIVRTRDSPLLHKLDAVLDVGGIYDQSRDRYDHHQKRFDGVFSHGFTSKLSSAELLYKVQCNRQTYTSLN
ncbi:hypothetical protein NE237_013107 [Protea cynaroides]|uniref:Uncharacterized protein n=1 Tax=Protea cynaroides TaxID=273540 RepID=A0A9Q0GZ86_9MAGN|nr:hypothetical protein NE237_013107 [Protea cynaroides]